MNLQNARSVWGSQSRQYAACAEIAMSYYHEITGSASGNKMENGKGKLGIDGQSEVGRSMGREIEEAFRGLNIAKT